MAEKSIVVAGPNLQRALRDLSAGVKNVDLTLPQKNSIKQSVSSRKSDGGNTSDSAYNGYFTLKDVSTYNEDGTVQEYRVAVCDGKTWDQETETSGKSVATCNGYKYSFQSIIIPIEKSSEIYIVCGRNQDYYNGIVSYTQDDELNSKLNVAGYSFYHIGSVVVTDEGSDEGSERRMEVIQRHISESAYIPFDQFCGDFEASAQSNGDGTFDKNTILLNSGVVSVNGSYNYVEKTTITPEPNSYAVIRYTYETNVIDILCTTFSGSSSNIIDVRENGNTSSNVAFSIIGKFDSQSNWYHSSGNIPHSIWIFDTVCKELTE